MKDGSSPTALIEAKFVEMMRRFESSSQWMIEHLKLKREATGLPNHSQPVAENHSLRESKK